MSSISLGLRGSVFSGTRRPLIRRSGGRPGLRWRSEASFFVTNFNSSVRSMFQILARSLYRSGRRIPPGGERRSRSPREERPGLSPPADDSRRERLVEAGEREAQGAPRNAQEPGDVRGSHGTPGPQEPGEGPAHGEEALGLEGEGPSGGTPRHGEEGDGLPGERRRSPQEEDRVAPVGCARRSGKGRGASPRAAGRAGSRGALRARRRRERGRRARGGASCRRGTDVSGTRPRRRGGCLGGARPSGYRAGALRALPTPPAGRGRARRSAGPRRGSRRAPRGGVPARRSRGAGPRGAAREVPPGRGGSRGGARGSGRRGRRGAGPRGGRRPGGASGGGRAGRRARRPERRGAPRERRGRAR